MLAPRPRKTGLRRGEASERLYQDVGIDFESLFSPSAAYNEPVDGLLPAHSAPACGNPGPGPLEHELVCRYPCRQNHVDCISCRISWRLSEGGYIVGAVDDPFREQVSGCEVQIVPRASHENRQRSPIYPYFKGLFGCHLILFWGLRPPPPVSHPTAQDGAPKVGPGIWAFFAVSFILLVLVVRRIASGWLRPRS